MNINQRQAIIEKETQRLIDIYQQWDQEPFEGYKKVSIDCIGRKIKLKINKSREFNSFINFFNLQEMHRSTIYSDIESKEHCYVKMTLEALPEDLLSKEEAVTFVKQLHKCALQGLIVLKNIKFKDFTFTGKLTMDKEVDGHREFEEVSAKKYQIYHFQVIMPFSLTRHKSQSDTIPYEQYIAQPNSAIQNFLFSNS